MRDTERLRVLVLSRTYPNKVTPFFGPWVESLVRKLSEYCEIKVVAPVPYCPPLPALKEFTRFRSIERRLEADGIEVFHPRFLSGPGYSTYGLESDLYFRSIISTVDQIRKTFEFDLIHANFVYPDGVAASKLARRYGVPFIITEHAAWIPWMNDHPRVRRKAVQAAYASRFHIAVSGYTKRTIAQFTPDNPDLRVIPNGFDPKIFFPNPDVLRDPDQILCVGVTRHVKGIDVLLESMKLVVARRPQTKLVMVGGGFNRDYSAQETELHAMSKRLGLETNVDFVGFKGPNEVADLMRRSSLLVLPSRRETFATVLVESLACGTPVVSTDCGGPRDIVNEKVGVLVSVEDPQALADGILDVFDRRSSYDGAELSKYAESRFAWDLVARKTLDLYYQAVARESSAIV